MTDLQGVFSGSQISISSLTSRYTKNISIILRLAEEGAFFFSRHAVGDESRFIWKEMRDRHIFRGFFSFAAKGVFKNTSSVFE